MNILVKVTNYKSTTLVVRIAIASSPCLKNFVKVAFKLKGTFPKRHSSSIALSSRSLRLGVSGQMVEKMLKAGLIS